MTEATKLGKQVYVPTIVAKAQPLMFVPWTPDCELVKNQFGILEPVVLRLAWREPREMDFVITPLVAFDESCNRIGVGGGYYDRSFAFLNTESDRSAYLAGFALELQKIATIENREWDVPLDCVVTESRRYAS
jgi:5-formyltetrahydrofolate cyclo-ligase